MNSIRYLTAVQAGFHQPAHRSQPPPVPALSGPCVISPSPSIFTVPSHPAAEALVCRCRWSASPLIRISSHREAAASATDSTRRLTNHPRRLSIDSAPPRPAPTAPPAAAAAGRHTGSAAGTVAASGEPSPAGAGAGAGADWRSSGVQEPEEWLELREPSAHAAR